MKKYLLLITTSLFTQIGNTQVLLSEDFNSYPTGHLNNDYTGATVGQGGWVVLGLSNGSATAMVAAEAGKGNVLTFLIKGTSDGASFKQNNGIVQGLWNNRTIGNNVLKLEYELYGLGNFDAFLGLHFFYNNTHYFPLMITRFHSDNPNYYISSRHHSNFLNLIIMEKYNVNTFPYNTWIKIEMYIDYTNKKAYTYIPILNLFGVDSAINIMNPENILFGAAELKPGSVVKYDNIKLTALSSVPSYILSATKIASAKFNIYPNPTTNVVNITNSENMLVEQVTVYDITGKQLSTQTFNNESQIQLNVENLASGTYMLHIQTNAGLAVKKLVKQ